MGAVQRSHARGELAPSLGREQTGLQTRVEGLGAGTFRLLFPRLAPAAVVARILVSSSRRERDGQPNYRQRTTNTKEGL